jgi:hypothetical protein
MTGPSDTVGHLSPGWLKVARRVAAAAARRAGFRPRSATLPPAPTRVAADGSLRVGPKQLEAILAALYDASVCHDDHGGQPTVAAAYRRVWRRLTSRLEAVPQPGSATVVEAGEPVPDPSLAEALGTLRGEDRTWLLVWLADTSPEVARTGLAAVGRYHVRARERQRIRQNQRRTKRRYWKRRFAA